MPFDIKAAKEFSKNPYKFITNNFFYVRGQQLLSPRRVRKIDKQPAGYKFLGGLKNHYDINNLHVRINDNDLVINQSIANRKPPTAYVGFEKKQNEPHAFTARVQQNQANTHREVYFLNASANQICAIKLPKKGGPDVVLTDPLSGCSIFVTTKGDNYFMFHANALALRSGHAITYMRNLFQRFIRHTDHTPVFKLEKGQYYGSQDTAKQKGLSDKRALHRTDITVGSEDCTNAVGIRKNGIWNFYYQIATTVDSTRTGFSGKVKDTFKGSGSHKYRIEVHPFPAY